jgi:hypothetical protein
MAPGLNPNILALMRDLEMLSPWTSRDATETTLVPGDPDAHCRAYQRDLDALSRLEDRRRDSVVEAGDGLDEAPRVVFRRRPAPTLEERDGDCPDYED